MPVVTALNREKQGDLEPRPVLNSRQTVFFCIQRISSLLFLRRSPFGKSLKFMAKLLETLDLKLETLELVLPSASLINEAKIFIMQVQCLQPPRCGFGLTLQQIVCCNY